MRLLATTVLVSAASVMNGCSGWSSSEPSARCNNGSTAPITVSLLIDALDAEGFSAERHDNGCPAAGDSSHESTVIATFENGNLRCQLHSSDRSPYSLVFKDKADPYGDATARLASIDCALYVNEGRPEETVARFKDAMRLLEAEIAT